MKKLSALLIALTLIISTVASADVTTADLYYAHTMGHLEVIKKHTNVYLDYEKYLSKSGNDISKLSNAELDRFSHLGMMLYKSEEYIFNNLQGIAYADAQPHNIDIVKLASKKFPVECSALTKLIGDCLKEKAAAERKERLYKAHLVIKLRERLKSSSAYLSTEVQDLIAMEKALTHTK